MIDEHRDLFMLVSKTWRNLEVHTTYPLSFWNHTATLTLRCLVDCRQSTGRAATLHVSLTMDIDDRNCRIHAFYSLSTGLHDTV